MFVGKSVIITGASSGLGRALALKLAEKGARLALFSRNEKRLRETEALCRQRLSRPLVINGDVTDPDDCARLVERTIEQFHAIDYLVANAGVSMWGAFDQTSDTSIFRKMMETNYLGAVYCIHHALPHLKSSKGLIVGISSIQGKIGVPYHTGYAASKHALQGFLSSLRAELHDSGVDVLIVLPHWLKNTSLRENAFGPDGSPIGVARRGHHKQAIALDGCIQKILQAMRGRKRQLVVPRTLKVLPWLDLVRPSILEALVRRNIRD